MSHLASIWSRLRGRHLDALLVALIVGLAVGLRLAFLDRAPLFVSKDSQSYFLPAWDLVHGNGFQLGLRRTPGYPIFLALVQMLSGADLRSIALAQHLLGAVTAAFAFGIGRIAFGRVAGATGGVLVALSAPLIVYEHYLLTESLFTFAITGAMLLLVVALRLPHWPSVYIAGLTLGLAALVRPIGQLLAPIFILSLALVRLPRWRSAVLAGVVCGLGIATALLPWAVRNRLMQGLESPTTFGRTLIARTAYYDRGFTFYEPGWGDVGDPKIVRARQIVQNGARRRESDGTIAGRLRQELDLGPLEVNAVMRDVAFEAIARRPWYFIEGSLEMALRIFTGIEERVRNHLDEVKDVTWEPRTTHLLERPPPSQQPGQRETQAILNVYQPNQFASPLAALFILGVFGSAARSNWRVALPVGIGAVLHILVSAAVDGPQERYRYPIDPAIAVMVGGGGATIVWIVRSLARRTGRERLEAPVLAREGTAQ